jgi:hypothetical protein
MNNELGLHEVTSHETDTHNSATTGQVLRDFVAGMYDEAKQHPLKLAAEAGVGAALTVGTLLVAPEVAAGIAIAGIGIAFKGLGGSGYPFAEGLALRQGFYTAGTMTGVEDLTKHIEDRK